MILLVDDRPENILPLKKILELHEFSVDTAVSGEEALRKVLNQSYSVIILDVQMPGMDGFEVAQAVAGYSKAKDTSIIFLSAVNKEKEFIAKGYTSGGMDYLTKPVDPDILLLKVKTLNRLYEQQQELRAIQSSLLTEIEVRKQAQEELAERMQELRSTLESLPQMAFTVTGEGQIEFVNEHWFHYSSDSGTFPETHPDDVAWEAWNQQRNTGVEFTCEVRLKELQSEECRYHLLRITPIKRQGIIVRWVGTLTDIHQQKLAAELLEQKVESRTKELLIKNVELERTNHELQQFAWVVSHDLKEPLRKIQIFNDVIKEKYLKENQEAVAYLERSIHSSARMSRLINDVLEYSQLSVSAAFQPTNLNTLIQELLNDFEEIIRSKQATLFIEELPVIDTIPSRIRQVFQNLISNALKFTAAGKPPVIQIRAERIEEKSVESKVSSSGDYCRIVVEDNGIGFDEKFLQRIFIIFQRLNDQSSYEGTGIGLAIAKKNMDKHNGLISAKSRPNEGASFILILPIHQTNETPESL
ncbi:hybrid sensor histidine kinase/response regulator [Siphonobacter sp. BAB-5405]|uniref:hybrid sensor histidine kinase/response regulator n=1 Tax=Siphonobacter sp. BAB-5405 TaxID=1864825 RepID=UPI000C7F88F9|nr:response regulator [Siphonobacter sp. BAB-5405]PMD94171.1 hybrid sensor histidine kinase/response regulator [Siphonobacter sp. BAB-5405]